MIHRPPPPSGGAPQPPAERRAATGRRGPFRLAAVNGRIVAQGMSSAEVGARTPANGDDGRPLTDVAAYDAAIDAVNEIRSRCGPASDARRDFGYLLADLERARARLRPS